VPPAYPTRVRTTPLILPNRESGPQNQPNAKVAVCTVIGAKTSMGGFVKYCTGIDSVIPISGPSFVDLTASHETRNGTDTQQRTKRSVKIEHFLEMEYLGVYGVCPRGNAFL